MYILSQDTNKRILNLGIKYCVDHACVPIKISTGHVESIKEECDLIVIRRIISIREKEFICPKFCGLHKLNKAGMGVMTQENVLDSNKNLYIKELFKHLLT